MSFIISEEEYRRVARELQLEEDLSPKKIAHLRDTFSHIDSKHIRMSPSIGKTLFGDLKTTKTFHTSSINRIDDMISLIGGSQKKPLSSFTFMDKDLLSSMRGIQTEGGIIYELEGTALFKGTSDIMSIPDEKYRRWLQSGTVIPSDLRNEYVNAINTFHKIYDKPSLDDKEGRTRYVLFYTKVVEDFIKKHKDEIREFVIKDRGGSWDEILIQQFKVKDILLTVNNVRSHGGEYDWLIEYKQLNDLMDRRELNEFEMVRWKEYHTRFMNILNKLSSLAEGELTYTEDTKVAISWVMTRGGIIDREEYSKKLKGITENKTNKKMSKKIKISESQLKTIMERKHTYVGDTNEEEKFDIDQLEDKDKEKIDVTKPEEVEEQDFGMDSGTSETEEDSLMNESIKNIRNNFKRFL
jgi:hypothetical protein